MDPQSNNNTESKTKTTTLDKDAIMTLIFECGTVDYYDSETYQMHGKFKLKDNMLPCDLLCTQAVRNQRILHTKDEKNGVWRHTCTACGRTKSPCDTFMLPKNSNLNKIFDDFFKYK